MDPRVPKQPGEAAALLGDDTGESQLHRGQWSWLIMSANDFLRYNQVKCLR